MVNVRLYGHIGTKFPGDEPDGSWLLDVQTPREAMLAIEANHPGIRQYLIDSAKYGVEYRVIIDNEQIETVEQVWMNSGLQEYEYIDIIPEIIGASGTGIWGIIAGVVLIIVGIITIAYGGGFLATYGGSLAAGGAAAGSAAAAATATGIAAAIGTALIGVGVSLAVGGIEALLITPENVSTTKNKPSTLFGGQINTQGQGGAIPLCYGLVLIGSQLVSAYLTSIQVDPKSGDPINDNDPANPAYAVNSVWAQLNGRILEDTPYTPDFDGVNTTGGMAGGAGVGGIKGNINAQA